MPPQSTYRITTEDGTYDVTVGDEAPTAAPASQTKEPHAWTAEEWQAMPRQQKMTNILQWAGKALASATGMGQAGAEAVDNPKTTLATSALGAAAPIVADALPNAARAGAKFQSVMSTAKDIPIDISGPGNAALRILQLSERGGGVPPRPVMQFAQRVTNPKKPPMTYDEARDFASNISRLSANEFNRLTPVVHREVAGLRVALNKAVGEAASQAGRGSDYASAMKEYARAMQMKNVADKLWAGAKRAAPFATIAGLGSSALYGLKHLLSEEP
jgi:hypothetical protein